MIYSENSSFSKAVFYPYNRYPLGRCTLCVRIHGLAFRPADLGGSSMVRSYDSSGFSMSSGNGGGQMAGNPGRQTAGSTVKQTLPAAGGESQGPFSDGEAGSGLPDGKGLGGRNEIPVRCHVS